MKYKRQPSENEVRDEHDLDEKTNEVVEKIDEKVTTIQNKQEPQNEEETFKKRYGDLRRYAQQKEAELQRKITELENTLANSATEAMPASEEELEEWVQKYPVVAKMVQSLARKEAERLDEKHVVKSQRIEELEKGIRIKEQMNKLMRLQPDFYGPNGILASQEFTDWLEHDAKPWAKQALTDDNNPDADAASDAIELFKVQTGWGRKKQEPVKSNDAAASVPTKTSTKPDTGTKRHKFSESQVAKMSAKEFDAKEEEIMEAMKTGQFLYDLSAAS